MGKMVLYNLLELKVKLEETAIQMSFLISFMIIAFGSDRAMCQ